MEDLKSEILYHLNILLFLRSDQSDAGRVESCINRLLAGDSYNRIEYEDIEEGGEEKERNVIKHIDNKVMKIAYIREADNIEKRENMIISNKKKYRFDNVFGKDEYISMVGEIMNFLAERIACGVSSSILLNGLSGSGKSTIAASILSNLNSTTFSLCCIYNNNRYIYKKGSRIPCNDIKVEHVFHSGNIMNIIESFSMKEKTPNNPCSSRAHIVLKVFFPNNCFVEIMDLCGNEKLVRGKETESKYIMKSLFNVFSYLRDNRFRDSKCLLLNMLKKSTNIVVTLLLHDNIISKATGLLSVLKSIL